MIIFRRKKKVSFHFLGDCHNGPSKWSCFILPNNQCQWFYVQWAIKAVEAYFNLSTCTRGFVKSITRRNSNYTIFTPNWITVNFEKWITIVHTFPIFDIVSDLRCLCFFPPSNMYQWFDVISSRHCCNNKSLFTIINAAIFEKISHGPHHTCICCNWRSKQGEWYQDHFYS